METQAVEGEGSGLSIARCMNGSKESQSEEEEGEDYGKNSEYYRSCLLRSYGALSPSNPREISSPPFPTARWLAHRDHQSKLFDTLVTQQSPLTLDQGRAWKSSFWRRVIDSIQLTLSTDPSFEQEEIDERILMYYISLQQESCRLDNRHLRRDLHDSSSEIRTYFYGQLDHRQSWRRIHLHENKSIPATIDFFFPPLGGISFRSRGS